MAFNVPGGYHVNFKGTARGNERRNVAQDKGSHCTIHTDDGCELLLTI